MPSMHPVPRPHTHRALCWMLQDFLSMPVYTVEQVAERLPFHPHLRPRPLVAGYLRQQFRLPLHIRLPLHSRLPPLILQVQLLAST